MDMRNMFFNGRSNVTFSCVPHFLPASISSPMFQNPTYISRFDLKTCPWKSHKQHWVNCTQMNLFIVLGSESLTILWCVVFKVSGSYLVSFFLFFTFNISISMFKFVLHFQVHHETWATTILKIGPPFT